MLERYRPPSSPRLEFARSTRSVPSNSDNAKVDASEATEREIDITVRDIVVKAFDRATEVLQARRADLDEGARLLLAQETVTADQFPAIRSAGPHTKSAA